MLVNILFSTSICGWSRAQVSLNPVQIFHEGAQEDKGETARMVSDPAHSATPLHTSLGGSLCEVGLSGLVGGVIGCSHKCTFTTFNATQLEDDCGKFLSLILHMIYFFAVSICGCHSDW